MRQPIIMSLMRNERVVPNKEKLENIHYFVHILMFRMI